MSRSAIKGMNGYSGELLRQWFAPESEIDGVSFRSDGSVTKTDTIPIWLQLQNDAGDPLRDIANEKLVISFATSVSCLLANELSLEVEISPSVPAIDAIFAGAISDDETFLLPVGIIYVSLKHIDANGVTNILDMCKTKVNACVSQRRG